MTGVLRQMFARAGQRPGVPGFGVLGFGGSMVGNLGRRTSDDEAARTLDQAWDRGIRLFDTAPHYGLGLSERRIGAALAERPRTEFVLSTKVGRLLVPNPRPTAEDTEGFVVPGDVHRQWDFSLAGVRRSLEESLTRLGLDAVDILYAHDPDQAPGGAARAGLASLAQLKADGLVKAIGIGTNATAGLREIVEEGLVDVIMMANRYSMLDHSALESVLAPALCNGVTVIAAGVFATGLLATAQPEPGATFDYRPASRPMIERATRIASICADHGVEMPAAALAFPLLHPAVAAVVVGMRTAAEVDSDVQHFQAEIPAQLWLDLVAEKLVSASAVPTRPPTEP